MLSQYLCGVTLPSSGRLLNVLNQVFGLKGQLFNHYPNSLVGLVSVKVMNLKVLIQFLKVGTQSSPVSHLP